MLALPALLASLALSAGAANAQDDPFTVSGVPIDATADTAAAARERAIAEGTPRALRRLFERLTLPDDSSRLPSIPASQATSLAIGFSVDNEIRQPTRYRGDLTVSFEPEGVRRILRNYGVPFLESAAPPTLVVPVYVVGQQAALWNANPWGEAWDEGRYIGGFAPVVLPTGFGTQVSLISADAVARGNVDALSALANAYGVNRVLLAVARPQGDTLAVDLTLVRMEEELDVNALILDPALEGEDPLGGDDPWADERPDDGEEGEDPLGEEIGPDEPESTPLGTITVRAGESETPFQLAADRAHEALANEWKQRSIIRSRERTEMQVTVLYDDVREWHSLSNALGVSPFIVDRRLDALSRDGAYMTLTYRGLREQLAADLQRRGVALRSHARLGDVALTAERAETMAGLSVSAAPGGSRPVRASESEEPSVSTSSISIPAPQSTSQSAPRAPAAGTPADRALRPGMSADEVLRGITPAGQ